MDNAKNVYGQPIGYAVPDWSRRPLPTHGTLHGCYCRVEKLTEQHIGELHAAFAQAPNDQAWTYLPYGPFSDETAFVAHMQKAAAQNDPLHHAIIDNVTGKVVGSFALMRIDPDNGVIEVGHVLYSPLLQQTRAGTEAMYLLMWRVFEELGYRRYEWKCDSLNLPSRRAAERYGFRYEGIFRQAIVYKGRSRDTAWFSIIDGEWPVLRAAFEKWLALENFDEAGRQRESLAELRKSS